MAATDSSAGGQTATSTPEDSKLIDAANGYAVRRTFVSQYHNDFVARDSLWSGLELLYLETRRVEQRIVPDPLPGSMSIGWGGIDGVPSIVLQRLACFFDWYSVSACNFVLLTGWLLQEASALPLKDAYEYRKQVLPDVLTHRNKIGAHPSRLFPQTDGQATQEASNYRQLALVNDRFFANYMMFVRRSGNEKSDSRDLKPWSLTETHERMRSQFVVAPPSSETKDDQTDGQTDSDRLPEHGAGSDNNEQEGVTR